MIKHDVPAGKHALITVRQPRGDLVWIQTPISTENGNKNDKESTEPQLVTWDDCDTIQVNNNY